MSKYIPGNQKHLSLQDRIYIQNELSKGSSFKELPVSYARIQLPSPKRSNPVDFLIGGIKVPSIMPITSAFIGTIAKRKMPVEKLFSVA